MVGWNYDVLVLVGRNYDVHGQVRWNYDVGDWLEFPCQGLVGELRCSGLVEANYDVRDL